MPHKVFALHMIGGGVAAYHPFPDHCFEDSPSSDFDLIRWVDAAGFSFNQGNKNWLSGIFYFLVHPSIVTTGVTDAYHFPMSNIPGSRDLIMSAVVGISDAAERLVIFCRGYWKILMGPSRENVFSG